MKHPLNTLLFLNTSRNSICEALDYFKLDESGISKSYIRNEASDYQIITVLTRGYLPNEKFNFVDEEIVWEEFKRWLVLEQPLSKKMFEKFGNEIIKEVTKEVVFEMGPVSHMYLSSANTILELHMTNGFLKNMCIEAGTDTYKKFLSNVERGRQAAQVPAAMAPVAKKPVESKPTGGFSLGDPKNVNVWKKSQELQKKKQEQIAAAEKQKQEVEKERQLKEKWKKEEEEKAKAAAPTPAQKTAGQSIKDLGTKISTTGKQLYQQGKPVASTAYNKAKSAASTVWNTAKSNKLATAGALGAGALGAYAVKKMHERYFSKAAKQCAGLSGSERSECIERVKQQQG